VSLNEKIENLNFKLYKEEEKYSHLFYNQLKYDNKQDENLSNNEIIKNINAKRDDLLSENTELKNK